VGQPPVESVASGLAVITPEDLDTLLPASDISMEEELAVGEPLTPRETEVLAMLAEGAREQADCNTANIPSSSTSARSWRNSAQRAERKPKEGLIII
jgi:hypothetical protein